LRTRLLICLAQTSLVGDSARCGFYLSASSKASGSGQKNPYQGRNFPAEFSLDGKRSRSRDYLCSKRFSDRTRRRFRCIR
jgi:hypothetical protein